MIWTNWKERRILNKNMSSKHTWLIVLYSMYYARELSHICRYMRELEPMWVRKVLKLGVLGYLQWIPYILKWGPKSYCSPHLPSPTADAVGRPFMVFHSHATQIWSMEQRTGSWTIVGCFSFLACLFLTPACFSRLVRTRITSSQRRREASTTAASGGSSHPILRTPSTHRCGLFLCVELASTFASRTEEPMLPCRPPVSHRHQPCFSTIRHAACATTSEKEGADRGGGAWGTATKSGGG
jgi:hypothetical protein